MATIEFEKTSNGQTRYKWSNRGNSNYILNPLNMEIFSTVKQGEEHIVIELGLKYSERISFKKSELTTINGVAAPDSVEDIMQILTDEVFGG